MISVDIISFRYLQTSWFKEVGKPLTGYVCRLNLLFYGIWVRLRNHHLIPLIKMDLVMKGID